MQKKKFTLPKKDIVKVLLSVMFMVLIFVPLIRMFLNMDMESIRKVFQSPSFGPSIVNSLTSTVISTVITVVLAYTLAVCTERVNIKAKGLFSLIFILPMLIPSISHGMGLIFLFGNNGILTNLFGMKSGIYGLPGIVIGSVLYAFPVAYLMFADVMKYEDSSPYEAAAVLGIPRVRRFTQITLPYLRKPLISILFATFTLIITDYGVPLTVGGKFTTVPVVMYQEVIGQLDFGKGAVYGCLLLIPAVLAFIIDLLNKDKGNSGFVTHPFGRDDSPVKKTFSYLFCGLVSVCTIIPVVAFIILAFANNYPGDLSMTFRNFATALSLKADDYLINSLVIALLVSVIGVTVAFLTAYMSARMKSRTSRFLHLSAITTTAIPGIVLGLAYVLTFKGSFIYGTIAILVMVNTVHFIASPYLMMYNSMSKLNENLENVGLTLGISRTYMIRDVFVPLCSRTLMEMFSYFFVNCMMTISAVSFLASTANKPISLMINQFEAQQQLECTAVVSLVILAVNLLMKGIIHLIRRKLPA